MSGSVQDNSGVVLLDILSKIQNSQAAEQKLITQLDKLTSQTGYIIDDNILSIISSINSLSESRIAMFSSVSQQADVLQSGVANSRIDLVSQLTLLGVVEDQINKAKESMENLQNSNDTKMRLVEINTYYGKRYAAQSKLMKLIILICIPLLILFILRKKGLLPDLISKYAIAITIAVGAIFVIRAAWDIHTRSNMDFDEYQWNYEDPSSHTPTVWQYNKENLFNLDNPIKALLSNLGLCVGSNCCANGMYFDKAKQQCTSQAPAGLGVAAAMANASKVKENFVCGSGSNTLNASAFSRFNKDEEKQNGISPFSYSNDFALVQ
jgi:hypothetical protein